MGKSKRTPQSIRETKPVRKTATTPPPDPAFLKTKIPTPISATAAVRNPGIPPARKPHEEVRSPKELPVPKESRKLSSEEILNKAQQVILKAAFQAVRTFPKSTLLWLPL